MWSYRTNFHICNVMITLQAAETIFYRFSFDQLNKKILYLSCHMRVQYTKKMYVFTSYWFKL